MSYIIKSTSALITSILTDAGRNKLSQGNFNISYFQVGDSEVCYGCAPGFNQKNGNVLQPNFNDQNNTGSPQSTKNYVKYPFYLAGSSGLTYGIPFNASQSTQVFNTAEPLGFFSGTSAFTTTSYTINTQYRVTTLSGGTTLRGVSDGCGTTRTISANTFLFLLTNNSGCGTITGKSPMFVYRVQSASTGNVVVDRTLPNYTAFTCSSSRMLNYPSTFTPFYDSETPSYYWSTDAINFETPCDISQDYPKVWNMSIVWSENFAGYINGFNNSYENYQTVGYLGTKEYFGYQTSSGQSVNTGTSYYNSFSEKITVDPEMQRAIAIVHYTNQSIDNFYGEKFATEPYDVDADPVGLARNFSVEIPWLMWHKSTGGTMGQTFYIDPTGFTSLNLAEVKYITSGKNSDMNNPGIRYYDLWDNKANSDGYPNRVGKVFPDHKMIVFDDQEIIAAMSYASNRSWTLPVPKVSRIVPNVCAGGGQGSTGVLTSSSDTMYVTYRFNSTGGTFTNSLHCNVYSKISGDPENDVANVSVRFGNEFPFMNGNPTSSCSGFNANQMYLLVQKTSNGSLPSPTDWRYIDVTSTITKNGIYLRPSGITGTTFVIDETSYNNASTYYLSDYMTNPSPTQQGIQFGDEIFFYGTIKTDIAATIYEMKYEVNLTQEQFQKSSNPTWNTTYTPYVTEIGLYDSNKDLVLISKLQSPTKRTGLQQFVIKLDF